MEEITFKYVIYKIDNANHCLNIKAGTRECLYRKIKSKIDKNDLAFPYIELFLIKKETYINDPEKPIKTVMF